VSRSTLRINQVLLEAGLLLGSLAAILYLVRMIIGSILGVEWFWGGAVASLFAPLSFAAALRLTAGPTGSGNSNHA
jgi:hypothetical protein